MAAHSRRKLILGAAGAAIAVGAARAWYLHQALPPRDPGAEERFQQAQEKLLRENGGKVQSRLIQLNQPTMRAQVLEAGQGKPVLFIHGGYGMAAQWEPLLSRLSSTAHMYAPDRPGCGLSSMFDYRGVPLREHAVAFVGSVMDALQLPSVTLVGNSMGGYFSLVYALAHPERVERLILVGEPAGSAATIPPSRRMLATRGVNGLLYSTVMKPRDRATRDGLHRILVAHPERIPDSYVACCTAASEIPGATESWLTLLEDCVHGSASTLTYSLRPELHRLAMPTLFLWGEKDTFGPPSLAHEMAAMMPHGQAVTVADAGHLVWLDQPDQVESAVRSFLQNMTVENNGNRC